MIEISTWSATGSATARDGSGELSLDELSTQTCPAVVVLITCFWLMTPHQATIWWQTMQKKAIHSKSISYMCKSCIESYLEYRVLKLMDWRPISIYSNRPHFQEWAVHTLAFLTIPHCLPHSFLHDGGLVDSQPWRRGRLPCGVACLRRQVGGSLPSLPEPPTASTEWLPRGIRRFWRHQSLDASPPKTRRHEGDPASLGEGEAEDCDARWMEEAASNKQHRCWRSDLGRKTIADMETWVSSWDSAKCHSCFCWASSSGLFSTKATSCTLNHSGFLFAWGFKTSLHVGGLLFRHPCRFSCSFSSCGMCKSQLPTQCGHPYERGQDSELRIMALRSIVRGNEICISYINEDLLLKPSNLRRRILQKSWGFHCNCPRCSEDDSSQHTSTSENDEDRASWRMQLREEQEASEDARMRRFALGLGTPKQWKQRAERLRKRQWLQELVNFYHELLESQKLPTSCKSIKSKQERVSSAQQSQLLYAARDASEAHLWRGEVEEALEAAKLWRAFVVDLLGTTMSLESQFQMGFKRSLIQDDFDII